MLTENVFAVKKQRNLIALLFVKKYLMMSDALPLLLKCI